MVILSSMRAPLPRAVVRSPGRLTRHRQVRQRKSPGGDDAVHAVCSADSVSDRCWARARTVLWVATASGVMRIPVSVSMWVRISRLPSESSPWSAKGRSGSMVRRKMRLSCSPIRRRNRSGHSWGDSVLSSARNASLSVSVCPVARNASAKGKCSASVVSHGVPMIGT